MPSEHARLSPSSAERWMHCPASVKLAGLVPPEVESDYAAEGTAAHALAEIEVRYRLDWITYDEYEAELMAWRVEHAVDDFTEAEMRKHAWAYRDLIVERMDEHPGSKLYLEQRMDSGVPECWGTSDAVIVSPVHVEIIDFKYGAGVAVEALGNPQLRLYAGGALRTYGGKKTKLIRCTVHQPRMDHILTAEMTADELVDWLDNVATPKAVEALGDDPSFGPSVDACRWCPASGRCAAQAEAAFPDDLDDPPDFALLPPEETARYLAQLPQLKQWAKALEDASLHRAYSENEKIPGYKVVMSGGKRSVRDPAGLIDFLTSEEGGSHPKDKVSKVAALGIGDYEKLLGKDVVTELTDYIKKGDGSPSLVPESDSRPDINPHSEATKAFADDIEE